MSQRCRVAKSQTATERFIGRRPKNGKSIVHIQEDASGVHELCIRSGIQHRVRMSKVGALGAGEQRQPSLQYLTFIVIF